MRHLLALFLFLAACQTLPAPQAQDRIVIARSGSIIGGYSLIVTPDDRVVYDAYGSDIAPGTPGWAWGDVSRVTGQASLQAPGAYRRALVVLRDVRAQSAPAAPPCNDGSTLSIRLIRGGAMLFESVARACLASMPAGSAGRQHFSETTALSTRLRAAILPPGWLAD